MFEVRKMQTIKKTCFISIPQEYGFKKGDSIKVEKIDDKVVLTKVE